MTGTTPDILECLDVEFYDRVWWIDKKKPSTTDENVTLGRWIVILHKIRSDMCYWVLLVLVHVNSQTTVQHVTRDEPLDPSMAERVKKFDEDLDKRLDDTDSVNPEVGKLYIGEMDHADDVAHRDSSNTPSDEEYANMKTEDRPEQDDVDDEAYDKYIVAEVILDVPGEGAWRATVKHRVENADGMKAGMYHRNPLMDTREYELEYQDGTQDQYFSNIIADNLYSLIDSEGHQLIVL